MIVLGFNGYAHDAGVALLEDGRPLFVVEEERLNRVRKTTAFPANGLGYIRTRLGIELRDIDLIVFPWQRWRLVGTVAGLVLGRFPPALSLLRSAASPNANVESLVRSLGAGRQLARAFGVRRAPGFAAMSHHLAHAYTAFLLSPFERAAVVVADAFGEESSTTVYEATRRSIRPIASHRFFNSLGVLYSMVTKYLGFRTIHDEGKVMALAAYGEDSFCEDFQQLLHLRPNGRYVVDEQFFGYFRYGELAPVSDAFIGRFGPPRLPDEPIGQRHMDIARALQRTLENGLLHVAKFARHAAAANNLCLGGGIALNCLANMHVLSEAGFERVFVPPNPNDAGVALGAALAAHHLQRSREAPHRDAEPVSPSPYLGPRYDEGQMAAALAEAGVESRLEHDVAQRVARELAQGRIVGWFQGAAEMGPRALGNRSILADPRDPFIRDRLNEHIKLREFFRPYAPSVLAEHADEFFVDIPPSLYMSFAARVRPERRREIPSVAARDGTARVQMVTRDLNPLLYDLLRHFHALTGVPMVLNTSFNRQEPPVCSPQDAIRTFLASRIDVLALGRHVAVRAGCDAGTDMSASPR